MSQEITNITPERVLRNTLIRRTSDKIHNT